MDETLYDRQLFAELYDVQPQAIVWMPPIRSEVDGQIIDFAYSYANEEGLKYLNLTRQQFAGLTLSNSPTLTEELRRKVLKEILHVFHSGEKSETVLFNPALNKWARVLRTRLRDGVLTVVQDITREKGIIQQLEQQAAQLEEQTHQLQEQKALLDNILKNSSNGISVSKVVLNERGDVIDALTVMANDAAVNYTGLPRDIYLTRRATEIDPDIIGSPYYQQCIKTLKTGEPFVTQYRLEATGRWLELTVSKLDSYHLIHIFTDVTPIKEAQLQLERTVQELKRSNTNLEDFAHAASHDMKEPLRKIRTFADRLKGSLENRMTEGERHLFERMETSADRMQLLVDDLLEFSHVSEQPREMELVNLPKMLEKVLGDLDLSIHEKGAQVTVGTLPQLKGNPRQLQQLFQNLVGNALKYSKPGTPPVITITARLAVRNELPEALLHGEAETSFHLIEVSDNGIGFEPRYAERIFEMFQRLHGKAEYPGTGVGLSIARKVVENHGGCIWAEAQPGVGATFKVLLPA